MLMTVKEVAFRLSVCPAVVYRLIDANKLEAHRIGLGRGTLRISEEQLLAFLNESKVDATQPCSPRIKLKHIQF